MGDADIPDEVKNPFERRVAITIAVIAVLLAVFDSRNDNAKTDALLKSIEASGRTTEAANLWAYFQSKSIKEHTYAVQGEIMPMFSTASTEPAAREKALADFGRKVTKYEGEKVDIKRQAEAKEAEAAALRKIARQNIDINERCDQAALPMQLAVIFCSVAILVGISAFWWIGIVAAVLGTAIGVSSYTMPLDAEPEEAAHPAAEAPAKAGEPVKPAETAPAK